MRWSKVPSSRRQSASISWSATRGAKSLPAVDLVLERGLARARSATDESRRRSHPPLLAPPASAAIRDINGRFLGAQSVPGEYPVLPRPASRLRVRATCRIDRVPRPSRSSAVQARQAPVWAASRVAHRRPEQTPSPARRHRRNAVARVRRRRDGGFSGRRQLVEFGF